MTVRPHLGRSAAALVVSCALLGQAPSARAGGEGPDPARATVPGVYVVTLVAPPAAEYAGGVRGLRATRPVSGVRFDRTRPAVAAYRKRLLDRQDALLRRVGDPAVLYRYTTALDGFAATLDSDQVQALRAEPGVLRVERSVKQHLDTMRLGVLAGRLRDRSGGPARAGRGVVVGVVDSGIWPGNPSFAGLADRTPGTAPGLPGFHGGCAVAEDWDVEDCTDKIVSARWFVRGFGEENAAAAEYLSPRDGTGHGSHVASRAAGDHGVRVQIEGQHFGTTAGTAPAARLAVYKACWTAPDPADDGCTTADTVAAVDAAVADGVDVLNYSVSGSQVRDDSVERAFLGAASAGVFVATSAGNHGPAAGSVGHVSPWVTTVAASADHAFSGAVRLGDGRSYTGAMVANRRVPSARLVLGADVAARGVSRAAAARCAPGSLDTSATQGTIVICDRGGGARVDKSASVATSGGVAMVLADLRGRGTDADVHAVPTVHLDAQQARAVKAYVRRDGARAVARLDPGTGDRHTVAPSIAGFSGRGPARSAQGDVLKPDLTATGVGVLGAVAPPSDSGRSWDLASGTSASAPQVAGLAALVLGVHPDWSPARVKSAMMTTAHDLAGRHGPLVQGAGQVDPSRVLDPGLVFDTPPSAWRRIAAGTSPARAVNAPSVAVGDLVGPTTVNRRITNVGRSRESYSARVVGMHGVDVQAFPATVRLGPGETSTVRLRITARPTVRADRDVTGWLVWRSGRHRVRVPMSVRPTVVAAPARVAGSGDTGAVVVRGRSGNGRTVKLRSTPLVPARTTPLELVPGRFDPTRPRADEDTTTVSVRVRAGADLARFAVRAARHDVDLYVYRRGRLVDSSTDDTERATLTLTQPPAGDYRVYVNAHGASGSGTAATGELSTWVVPGPGAAARHGAARIALSTDAVGFAPGRRFRYAASWQGLDPDRRYLGVVRYGDSDRRTLLEVTPR